MSLRGELRSAEAAERRRLVLEELAREQFAVEMAIDDYREASSRRAALIVEARDEGVSLVKLAGRLGMKRDRVSHIELQARARMAPR